jgi:hypothetical protein
MSMEYRKPHSFKPEWLAPNGNRFGRWRNIRTAAKIATLALLVTFVAKFLPITEGLMAAERGKGKAAVEEGSNRNAQGGRSMLDEANANEFFVCLDGNFVTEINRDFGYVMVNRAVWRRDNQGVMDSTYNLVTFSDSRLPMTEEGRTFIEGLGGRVFEIPDYWPMAANMDSASSAGMRFTTPCDSTDTASEKPRIFATAFSLEQNYPNPFNSGTSIRFELGKPGFVILTVSNVLGQEVATLVNERLEAGLHTANFGGAGLAGGVYFYQLSTGEVIETKKMLLLK